MIEIRGAWSSFNSCPTASGLHSSWWWCDDDVRIKAAYLMARLSFSYVIRGFCFLCPHSLATLSDWTNLKIPSSRFSHRMKEGFVIGSSRRSRINSHNLPFPFPVCVWCVSDGNDVVKVDCVVKEKERKGEHEYGSKRERGKWSKKVSERNISSIGNEHVLLGTHAWVNLCCTSQY